MPMPPYSGGRWGAHSPSALTFSCTFKRNAFDSTRSSSLAWPRRPRHNTASSGRIFSLTIRAVRIRMSLMWSLSPAMGVTLIGMAFPRIPSCTSLVRVAGAYADPGGMSWSTTHCPVSARS
jgi:hypothetical protein